MSCGSCRSCPGTRQDDRSCVPPVKSTQSRPSTPGPAPHAPRPLRGLGGSAPCLRDVLRVFVLRRRHPAPSLRCGLIGNELRAPRRLRAPRPTQSPSRRWPARPGGDSRRLLSTPVDYPSMREGRRLDALLSLQAHCQARSRHNSSRAPCSRLHKASRECYNLHARSSGRT